MVSDILYFYVSLFSEFRYFVKGLVYIMRTFSFALEIFYFAPYCYHILNTEIPFHENLDLGINLWIVLWSSKYIFCIYHLQMMQMWSRNHIIFENHLLIWPITPCKLPEVLTLATDSFAVSGSTSWTPLVSCNVNFTAVVINQNSTFTFQVMVNVLWTFKCCRCQIYKDNSYRWDHLFLVWAG